MRFNLADPVDSADTSQGLAQNVRLVLRLGFVRDVLVIASATNAEMRTRWRRALGRSRQQFVHTRANEFLFLLDGRHGDALRRQNERNEYGGPFVMRQAIAAVDQLFDCDVHWRHEN